MKTSDVPNRVLKIWQSWQKSTLIRVSLLIMKNIQNAHGQRAWRIPLICQIIPPGISFLAAITFLPESPTWFLMNNRRDKAEKAFLRFNGPQVDPESPLNQTLAAMESASTQQLIGVNFIAGYLTYYYALAGVNNPLAIAQASYAIQVFGNMCSWPLVERLGRRQLIVGGCIMMTALLPFIGGISIVNTPTALKATVALMTLWGFLYQASLGACAYEIGGEIPTPALRQNLCH
ncbi:hypothetical protein V500_02796 [Pseudogymnoascus sp. VKM F-4518 (FW-2643)]|nr:hypothetical protein V500_02796 [Pseudogymnoascus sp. VKM F-4518 (FW-2643)]